MIARLFISLVLALALGACSEETRSQKPNIVLIFADDLGWADLSVYGNTIVDTPNIDRIAAEGMQFMRFYSQPVCSPSRAELQSGQNPARFGLTDFIPGHWRPFEMVVTPRPALSYPADTPTLGERLSAIGYVTGYFGKWHLGDEGVTAESRGYGEAFTNTGFDHMVDDAPSIDVLAAKADDFMTRHANEPFFLMLSPTQPHVPLRSTKEKVEKYQARLDASGATLPVAYYGAMVDDLDQFVGAVLQRLDDLDLAKSTLVIFVSDNGGLEHLDLGLDDPITSNAPLRGEKGTIYEGGVRVPALIRWPGVVKPGAVENTAVTLADLLPTFLDIGGGAPAQGDFDGRSLAPLLTGKAKDFADRQFVIHYPHYHHGRPASALYEGDWKLIEFLDDNSVALFNLAGDIGEANDLAAADPERAAAMLHDLEAWREAAGARMPEPNLDFNPARREEWWDFVRKEPVPEALVRKLLSPGYIEKDHAAAETAHD